MTKAESLALLHKWARFGPDHNVLPVADTDAAWFNGAYAYAHANRLDGKPELARDYARRAFRHALAAVGLGREL